MKLILNIFRFDVLFNYRLYNLYVYVCPTKCLLNLMFTKLLASVEQIQVKYRSYFSMCRCTVHIIINWPSLYSSFAKSDVIITVMRIKIYRKRVITKATRILCNIHWMYRIMFNEWMNTYTLTGKCSAHIHT